MASTIAQVPEKLLPLKISPKTISWEAFKNRYLSREDDFTYEWVNGYVEKTKRSMDYKQLIIVRSLLRFFQQLSVQGKVDGYLTTEVDTLFSGSHRRPDMCYLTNEQIDLVVSDTPPVPKFVIEIISNNDKMKRAQTKLLDYWRAEVEVIWHIYPDLKMVYVYRGKNITVCLENDVCSAAPILPDFQMMVSDIFK